MKHPYFTFLSADNFYATAADIDPQLLNESLKSFRSHDAVMPSTSYARYAAREQQRQQQAASPPPPNAAVARAAGLHSRKQQQQQRKQCRIQSPASKRYCCITEC